MSSVIGVYDDHQKAVEAVRALRAGDFPAKQISIIGKAEVEEVDNDLRVTSKNPLNLAGIGIGTTLGAALGVLTGVGLFAIPGLGFLYGAGALVGAIAGIDFGIIGGGIASVLTTIGIDDSETKEFQQHLSEGRYLVVAQGNEEEVNHAKGILDQQGSHTHLAIH